MIFMMNPSIKNVKKINIHSQEELNDLLWLAREAGWCEFEDFTEPGIWVRKNNEYDALWTKLDQTEVSE